MTFDERRVRYLSEPREIPGSVLYVMTRDMRLRDNWALIYAQAYALKKKVPLTILYALKAEFGGGALRQFDFKLRALELLAHDAREKGFGFVVATEDEDIAVLKFIQTHETACIVSDYSPLRIHKEWKKKILSQISIPFAEVDAHNIVPVWHASQKREYGAYTLRPKIHRLIPEFCTDFPKLRAHPIPPLDLLQVDFESIRARATFSRVVPPVDWCLPGEKEAHKKLVDFLDTRLAGYNLRRNDPTCDGQSGLSPYLHYGMIAPQRVAYEVMHKSGIPRDDSSAFCEELIVRRELADNFCEYTLHYDSPDAFPQWARTSLDAHLQDERAYVYTREQFETAQTHDEVWNACQRELLRTGKMHGYMRMYWAKKILEWTRNYTEAMEIAIYLNDTYELDGRDPNGYAGIAWSIGGVHDRPWFDRPIFGVVRYMNASGLAKKFDVEKYVETWNK